MRVRRISSLQVAVVGLLTAITLVASLAGCVAIRASGSSQPTDPSLELIAEGERLVHNMDCNVCHTPKVFTAEGPKWDTTRLLSGHPADEGIPPFPLDLLGPQGWGGVHSNGLTAWAGPWGVSFGSNLTPDSETGTGEWTEEMFVEAMRTGIHVEDFERFLPPMPTYSRLTDQELHAIFLYLRSIEPVRNEVPEARLFPTVDQKE